MFHVSCIIVMITHWSGLCFSSALQTCGFYFHYCRCWGTDFLWSNN